MRHHQPESIRVSTGFFASLTTRPMKSAFFGLSSAMFFVSLGAVPGAGLCEIGEIEIVRADEAPPAGEHPGLDRILRVFDDAAYEVSVFRFVVSHVLRLLRRRSRRRSVRNRRDRD